MALVIDIVDDDDAVRDSLLALLESFGFEARGYGSAEIYLQQRESPVDCLLVDQHMPGMTGVDLLAYIRARGDTTPALMITGRCDSIIEPRAKELGARVLQKPVNEEELIAQIERLASGAKQPR